MSNLQELHFSLFISASKTCIDGKHLQSNIISYMPLLKRFTFNIHSMTHFDDQTPKISNEYLQETLKDFLKEKILCSVDYFQRRKLCQFHIYCLPHQVTIYEDLTNNFPGGIYRSVRRLTLFDEYPFEHEFFLRISQSFPFLQELSVNNSRRQNAKQTRRNEDFQIIEYPRLMLLDLVLALKDYYEQFLDDTKTSLPTNISVLMTYQSLKKVTRNFRRNNTRSNCAKIISMSLCDSFLLDEKSKDPSHYKHYFPRANIRC